MTLRRTGFPAALAVVALLAAACGGDKSSGGPTPFEDDSSGTTPASAEPSTVTTPTAPETSEPTAPPAKRAMVVVNPGKYRSNPAVAGFTRAIQEFYKARITHNPQAMNAWSSTIFYTDNEAGILQAKSQGLVMRPPGKIVVRAVRKGPMANSTTVDACFGPTMSWFDPKKKRYTTDKPNGSAISMDMYNTGSLWQLYQAHLGKFSCATTKYPAG